ncbi:unnamed protein product [Prunus armeniaca]|uniref:Uncharacterized protein n=1 Tax=Prunus armeniaca TaxID=36596 RepID=A0A6J5UL68_PRUAR|nr:unnamed protein product [Prunus armeniaca]
MVDKGKGKDSGQKITSEMGNAAANLKSYRVSLGQKEKELQESDIKRKNIDRRIISEYQEGAMSSNLRRYDVSLSSKGKAIASDGKTEKRMEELQKPISIYVISISLLRRIPLFSLHKRNCPKMALQRYWSFQNQEHHGMSV